MQEPPTARALISIEQVLRLVPVSRSTLLNMENDDLFPRGFYPSKNRKMFYADEVIAWLNTAREKRAGHRPSRRGRAGALAKAREKREAKKPREG